LKAAILTIGDELTCGYRLDTNSQAISQRLALLPIDVALHLSVSDEMAAIHTALHVARHVADVVIITGGLGPTEDDLTRQAVAAHFKLALEEDAEALTRIKERFAHRGREMTPQLLQSNRRQAQIPTGSEVIYNERGTAAGFYLPIQGKHIFATPGIPYEMMGMLETFILPHLRELLGESRSTRRAAVKVYGVPESQINEMIRPLLTRERNPLLGLLPHRGTITIEIVAAADSLAEAERLIERDLVTLRAILKHHVISEDERELPQVVADLLVERELTIATAEIGTGGLVAARLTEPEGCEHWFRDSDVPQISISDTLSIEAAAAASDEVSGEAAILAQVLAARQAAIADIGVGVGPIISSDNARRPHGAVYVTVNLQGQESHHRLSFNGDRNRVRQWAADAVLDLVRLQLLKERL